MELGSGPGFIKEVSPGIATSDIQIEAEPDLALDAHRLPFPDGRLRLICMMDVFHHLSDPEAFLHEAQRCLKPGERLFMVDQHVGWISSMIPRYLHHEPFNRNASDWQHPGAHPARASNGALAWIVFARDRGKFHRLFPHLRVEDYRPHSPLLYWLSGGLRDWTLLPGHSFRKVAELDEILVRVSRQFGSFVDIEVVRTPNKAGTGRSVRRTS